MEKSAFASSVVSEGEASLRGQSPRVEAWKGRYRSYRYDGKFGRIAFFTPLRRAFRRLDRPRIRPEGTGRRRTFELHRALREDRIVVVHLDFLLGLAHGACGVCVAERERNGGSATRGRRLGMPFSIRLGNRNPDGNRAPRRVGVGFVEPELDGRGTFGGSRRGTHRARVGGACVRLCGPHTARDARLDSWTIVTEPRHHRRHVFRFFQQKMRYLCMRIQSHETELSEWSSVHFFRMPRERLNVSASTSEVPSSTKFHLRTAWWRASHLELRCRRSVGRTRPRARHPRARARVARPGGRPAPVGPVSAVSRRCSCSGSPRSPSRA